MATDRAAAAREFPTGRTALVLAGAFSRGAFSAGALEVIAAHGPPIARIVATSAGALNGVAYAAGIRGGQPAAAAAALSEIWTRSSWRAVIDVSLREALAGRGISTGEKLRGLVRSQCERWLPGARLPVEICIIVTATEGDPEIARTEHATTFEAVRSFDGEAFDLPDERERLYQLAVAAAAFPGLYAPVEVAELGRCIDGGAVDNNPIKNALEDGLGPKRVDRVLLVTPTPRLYTPQPFKGLAFGEHIVEIVTSERLYRDLRRAAAVEASVTALERLVADGMLTEAQLAAVKEAVGMAEAHHLQIVEIRPAQRLPGCAVTGFIDKALRTAYVEEGRRAARRALGLDG